METQTTQIPGSDILIIDCGTSECKVGFAGENNQRVSIPTIVGRPKIGAAIDPFSSKDSYVGADSQQMRAVLNLNVPIERGVITNWDDMEIYFDYIFKAALKIDSSLYKILLTETPNNPYRNREKLVELMFEKFGVMSCFLAPAPPMALYAYGFHTGVVLDSGEGQTHIVAVHEGFPMRNSTCYIPLGGKDINNTLEKSLTSSGKATKFFQTAQSRDREFLRDLKEKLCYAALYWDEELLNPGKTKGTPYQLPDGHYIELKDELFRCVEPLFDPLMLDVKTGGIHENLYRAIQLSDPSIKHFLYGHIVLSGGNTLFSGLPHRIAKEMSYMAEPKSKVRVHAKADRKNAVFFGASLMSSLTTFKNMMITPAEYFENGPIIIDSKCF